MSLAHDSASGQLTAECKTFSHSFIVSENPAIMFRREEIHSLIYSIKNFTEQFLGPRQGAGQWGFDSEDQVVSTPDDTWVWVRGFPGTYRGAHDAPLPRLRCVSPSLC